MVEEEWSPAWNQIAVEVALTLTPKLVVGVHANVPPSPVPHADALAETVPEESVWRHRVPEPPAEETMRLVVDAVPLIVSAVVEAYGNTLAAVAVEVMAPVMARVEVAVIAPPK